MTKMIEINDPQEKWADLIAEAQTGTEVVLANGGRPLARLVPIEENTGERIAGLHLGQAWMSEDFDAPLTEEFREGKL